MDLKFLDGELLLLRELLVRKYVELGSAEVVVAIHRFLKVEGAESAFLSSCIWTHELLFV